MLKAGNTQKAVKLRSMLLSPPGGNRWQLVALPPVTEHEWSPETSRRQEADEPRRGRSRSPPRRHLDGHRSSRSCSPRSEDSRGPSRSRNRSRSRSRDARRWTSSPGRGAASGEAVGCLQSAAWKDPQHETAHKPLPLPPAQQPVAVPGAASTPPSLQTQELVASASCSSWQGRAHGRAAWHGCTPALPVVLLPQAAASEPLHMVPHALVPVPLDLLPQLAALPLPAAQPAWAAAPSCQMGLADAAGAAAAHPGPSGGQRTLLLASGGSGPQLALHRVGDLMQQLRRLLGPGAGLESLTRTTPDRAVALFATPEATLAARARLHGCQASGWAEVCLPCLPGALHVCRMPVGTKLQSCDWGTRRFIAHSTS